MKYWLGLFFGFVCYVSVHAQGESVGTTVSNYAGVNAVLLNPSAMHNQNTWLSFNFLSGNVFLHTDFAYMDKNEFNLRDVFSSNYVWPSHATGYGVEERPFYSYDRNRNTSVDQSARIMGPSLMLVYNQHAIALTTAVRTETNVRNLTPDLANVLSYGFSYYPQYLKPYQINDFNGTSLTWAEIGLSYAFKLNKASFDGWSFGISIKRLIGSAGGYLHVDQSTYTLLDSQTLEVANQSAELGLSAPINFDTNDFLPNELLTGRGWALDIGFTYQALLHRQPQLNASEFCEQSLNDYKYRIGVALLDVGSIRFAQNAQTHDFTNSTQVQGNMDGATLDNINQILQRISTEFYGSPTASFVSNDVKIKLPMALSAQYDYNTEWKHVFWNASLIYGIPLKGGALRRPSQLTLSPRYETRQLEFGIPFSLYQFRYPHVGLFARFGPLSIGSDWFTSLLGVNNFNGLDIYFSVKFQLAKDNCRAKRNYRTACPPKSRRFRWGF